ncbi:MAG TPA: polysaccharide biosynthesis/export family protein [Myxococcota bacterium]|nr:polysaccharide biosynthesis/export family protein [Myxococcota bacterium]
MSRSVRSICRLGLTAALLGALACAGNKRALPSVPELEGNAAQASGEYVIGPADLLSIQVWREEQLSTEVEVRPDGKISVPLLDDVQAAGLTPLALKQVITERLSEYVASPHVTVLVKNSRSKIVYMMGEIARPGGVSYVANMRVSDAIALSGGFSAFSDKSRVKVIRRLEDGSAQEFRFDYDAYIAGTDVAQNILLLPGDQVFVPQESPLPWR